MKILICGSRGINDPVSVAQAVEKSGMTPTHIVSGGARGVDTLARFYARSRGIDFTEYVADWDKYGKRAGYMRGLRDGRCSRCGHRGMGRNEPGHKTLDRSRDLARERGLRI